MITKPLNALVPRSSLKRLPLYLHLLENLMEQKIESVSCTQIAKEFDLDPTLVRKDIEMTGEVGTARVGFKVASLIGRIKSFLGWDQEQDAFLIGAGNLGRAILGYKDFKKYGTVVNLNPVQPINMIRYCNIENQNQLGHQELDMHTGVADHTINDSSKLFP